MTAVVDSNPKGRYLAHEVGYLAGVSGDRIGQWARRGYIRSSQSGGPPRVYSYQDVAEAMAVHELVLRNVDLHTIRGTIAALRDEFGDWPLQAAPLYLPKAEPEAKQKQLLYKQGRRLFDSVNKANQGVLAVGQIVRIASDLRRGGWAVRTVPGLISIEVDPDRMSGRPAIKGRRIAVADVVDIAAARDGKRILRLDYDLTERQIDDALRWWSAVQEFETAA